MSEAALFVSSHGWVHMFVSDTAVGREHKITWAPRLGLGITALCSWLFWVVDMGRGRFSLQDMFTWVLACVFGRRCKW